MTSSRRGKAGNSMTSSRRGKGWELNDIIEEVHISVEKRAAYPNPWYGHVYIIANPYNCGSHPTRIGLKSNICARDAFDTIRPLCL
jgi:hypothetical protein